MKAQTFHLSSPERRANCIELLNGIECNGAWQVEISEFEQTRNDAQNRLMWHWAGEVSQHLGDTTPDFVHGSSKLKILQPMYLSWGGSAFKRGEFVQQVLDRISDYRIRVAVAYDMVRTRKLGVERFAEYLTAYEVCWADEGVRLTTGDDLYYAAMGEAR